MKTLFTAACFAFLLLNAAGVESRSRSRKCHCDDDDDDDYDSSNASYKLFVFGNSFADTGNVKKGDLKWETRAWYEPYGMSDAGHDNKPTGRFSDGMVQSDFLAKILGQEEAPPPERIRREDGVDLSSGMNFANSGGGVLVGWNLDKQIDVFRKLLRHGIIDKSHLNQSVALVAISDEDYEDFPSEAADQHKYIRNVTDGIIDGVRQLEDLGVDSVLVNLLPPLGCDPWNSRSNNYTKCAKDSITGVHNKHLTDKLGDDDSVLLLDLDTVFKSIIVPKTKKLFYHRHMPCCESLDEDGFCGQVDYDGNPQYTLCDKPDEHFYWDDTNPTQAGWKAVMEQLEGPIKEYLDI
ncbi:hypothetical protein SETIT_2G360600v2 [Setaria italica]|uniref:SGNH hydrolase-type esterase domain-containing protein n=1 Tax=Setaria italica TaxID=4555 RepID=K3ZZS3_SETIT|nr:GDSL esterase/lipase At5g03600 [Setaria italica]RCV13623.1 hypothetical protein SETIT_2G360600v2 [Setaria italica]